VVHNNQEPSSQSSHEETTVSIPPSISGARFILILGGARSGKSAFAEKLAANSGRAVAFIATATASDEEMQARIAHHRATRPQAWHTLEEPLDLAGAIRRASTLADILLLDCITLWTSNWLLHQQGIDWNEKTASDVLLAGKALEEVEAMLHVLRALPAHKTLIAISNEVGLGLVPAYPLGRAYRDTLGYVNQRLACSADRVYLMVAGMAVDLKRLQEEVVL
jgi:adenosylcobinamide kinase / adenosylcobinamide-phosphate guanylyltransferase